MRERPPPNQALHLTGAAILVSREMKELQAAPAGELDRCAVAGYAVVCHLLESRWQFGL